jgi:hypothetical protein
VQLESTKFRRRNLQAKSYYREKVQLRRLESSLTFNLWRCPTWWFESPPLKSRPPAWGIDSWIPVIA